MANRFTQNFELEYFPFGNRLESSGTLPTDKLYTSQRLDSTGLYYYGARYYDPEIGRFISPDTIVPNPANPQSLNRYSYCLNNPLKYVDPSGHIVKIAGVRSTSLEAYKHSIYYGNYAPWDKIMNSSEYKAYSTFRSIAPELTGVLEQSPEIISIEWSNSLKPGEAGKWHAGMAGSGQNWIFINENKKGSSDSLIASIIGHEGFHGAICLDTYYSRNFAANEAFAFSFEYALDQKLGIRSNYLAAQMKNINPWIQNDISEAAKTLQLYGYATQSGWQILVSIFHYVDSPLPNWSEGDQNGDRFLTVAKSIWIK